MNTCMKSGAVAMFVLASLAGCAAQPPQPADVSATTEGPPPVAAASAATAVTAATGASAATSETAVAGAPTPAKVFMKVPGGYRLRKRGGTELYCKSVTVLGSRFAEEMCFTREQLDELSKNAESAMGVIEQSTKTCAGGGPCGGST
jgi:hypothetical protein